MTPNVGTGAVGYNVSLKSLTRFLPKHQAQTQPCDTNPTIRIELCRKMPFATDLPLVRPFEFML